ncbi:hypothetical protein DYB28_001033 [Aphanomyces astaci]|uniref:Uncharacterized protein n=2 Tax=Aphanomyces astaci TaxID=112090 RepID=A0A397AHM2_APHAT|nr:hypothetical protein DYB25_005684 [Aphanomyces astaci]RHY05147.1 hypothetical protein DYB36_006704 [Aphanomyces astaci]RHY51303.1 hypothetical protein DYB34_003803 [Aphanomyces astaci]RHY66776.1 hypothetical protein DYB38_008848 [Aphanomyces astaci]RHY85087.1 hypothetical protein DYB26_002911 [Aphanomyces astaci]
MRQARNLSPRWFWLNLHPLNLRPLNLRPLNLHLLNHYLPNLHPLIIRPFNFCPPNFHPLNFRPLYFLLLNLHPLNVSFDKYTFDGHDLQRILLPTDQWEVLVAQVFAVFTCKVTTLNRCFDHLF